MTEPTPEEIASAQPARPASKITYLPDIQRMLPQDGDAERGALASLLLAPIEVSSLCSEMGAELGWFQNPGYADIFMETMFLISERRPIDFITVCTALRDAGKLERIGGAPAITDLYDFIPTAANARNYLETIREKHLLRSMIRVGTDHASKGYNPGESAIDLLDSFERSVMRIRSRVGGLTVSSASQCVDEAWQDVEWRMENQGKIRGLTTGFYCLDEKCDGLHEQEFIVLAARPGLGKTALAMQMIEALSDKGVPTALFSLEMSRRQLFSRQIFSRAGVNWMKLKHKTATPTERQQLHKAADEIRAMRLTVEDTPGLSIQDFRGIARRLVQKGCKAIFVDSMSAMRSDSKEAQHKRDRSIAECASGFKAAAKELNIPIIVLCHLGRQVDKSDHAPTLSDLRESGAIEQDADTVLMMSQEWEDEATHIKTKITFPKQRYGEKNAHCELTFVKGVVRFEEDLEAAKQKQLFSY